MYEVRTREMYMAVNAEGWPLDYTASADAADALEKYREVWSKDPPAVLPCTVTTRPNRAAPTGAETERERP